MVVSEVVEHDYMNEVILMAEDRRRWREFLLQELDKREWTRAELARRAGIAPSIISRWISMRNGADSTNAGLIADAFGLDRDFVLEQAGLPVPRKRQPQTSEAITLHSLIDLIPWRERRAEYQTVEGILRMYVEQEERKARHPQ